MKYAKEEKTLHSNMIHKQMIKSRDKHGVVSIANARPGTSSSTFGAGRKSYEKMVSPCTKITYLHQDRSLPGPGYYSPEKGKEGNVSYTLRPKTSKECK